jgi:hypothetical protein
LATGGSITWRWVGPSHGDRHRLDSALLAKLSSCLTSRDRFIVHRLYEHRVLTSTQIRDLAFSGLRWTEQRLEQLYRLRVLERFRPLRATGSAPYHWVLDEGGAAVIAATRGVDIADTGWRRERALLIGQSQRLAHLVGVNGFFVSLAHAARGAAGCHLMAWWSEGRCAADWGDLVRPDGYGAWQDGDRQVGFLLEYDRGTERLDRLAGKIRDYERLAHTYPDAAVVVLFVFPSPAREASARLLLRSPSVMVATTPETGQNPSSTVWLPIRDGADARVRLIDLGDLQRGRLLHGDSQSYPSEVIR